MLRTYKLGEADRIVVFLTARPRQEARRGQGSAAAAVAFRRRARAAHTGARGVLREGAARAGWLELRRAVALAVVGGRPEALGHIGYFAELIDEWAQDGDPTNGCFALARRWSKRWPPGRGRAAGAVFRVLAAAAAGRVPVDRECHACGGALDSTGGGAYLASGSAVFTCTSCAPAAHVREPLSRDALAFLRAARRIRLGT